MNIIIHKGTHNTGGTCIEIFKGASRLIFDLGLPLNTDPGPDYGFEFEQYRPKVKGLYKDSKETNFVSAVFLSHFHPEHSKFISEIHPRIPVYLTESVFAVMKSLEIFSGTKLLPENVKLLKTNEQKAVTAGDFSVTAVPAGEDAPDTLAFIIRCGGKTAVYAGGMADYCRKGMVPESFIQEIPKNADLLLVEGAIAEAETENLVKTEILFEDEAVNTINYATAWPVLVNFNPLNTARLLSLSRACKKTNTIFVIDLLTAFIYAQARSLGWDMPDLHPGLFNILFFDAHEKALKNNNQAEFLTRMFNNSIKFAEITEKRKRLVQFRPCHADAYNRKKLYLTNKTLIYSQYDNAYYGQEQQSAQYRQYIENHNLKIHYARTNAPAYVENLKEFLDLVTPREVVPVHTLNPEMFGGLFENHNIRMCNDGEMFRL
ncbi:MAG: hypothetical protein A2252_01175 [Elusimicrobia bacterium RIFOXYA2_FULL_39_19]|nr:MAG: hypothetical protein A2252_01175 [Elusimicrobia bacterium RIFOXYA2_FULL_39_19]